MPSRTATLGIIALWLAATTWMIFRDFVPWWTATEPPSFMIDLDDEVAAKEIFWTIYSNEKKVGTARTEVKFLAKGKYLLIGELNLHDLDILPNLNFLGLELKRITSSYRVNHEGKIESLRSSVFLPSDQFPELALEVEGTVERRILYPKTTINGLPPGSTEWIKPFLPDLEQPVKLSQQGNIINITHPFNKIRHLTEGKSWLIPVLNPLPSLTPEQDIPYLLAEVFVADLIWNGQQVACWRVDFTNVKTRKLNLRVWVRQKDSAVLQHEARYAHMELIMKRVQ
jgi:hypothetical protein